ncbi:hypothetical protein C8Q80DRAFT_1127322 [Daedaleopsis nitida]|nr:hypothetical protein C8Q80DRAFT_1127322 [Daedaleopsis nitida]
MHGVLCHLAQVLFCFAIQSFTPGASGSASVNRTIDDDNGDVTTGQRPSYTPSDGWARGQGCTGCAIAPDIDINRSIPVNGSWHDSTYHPGQPDRTISVSFTGTAVYVFHLIANGNFFEQGVTTFTNLTFYIDNEYVGDFTQPASTNAEKIRYNVPVYTNTTLPNEAHVLETRASGPTASLILFDAIIYTMPIVEDDNTTSPSGTDPTFDFTPTPTQSSISDGRSSGSLPIGAIAGGTIGGVVIVAIIIATLLYVRKRRAQRAPSTASKVEPFSIDGASRGAPAEDLSGHRTIRTSMLPDLRFGRSRLMPGPGSSTTGTDTTAVDAPRGHRPRLPPAPSTAGSSTRSVAQTELIERIHALEGQVRRLEGAETPSSSSGTRTMTSDPSSRASDRSRGRSRSRARTGRSARAGRSANSLTATLRSELSSLREEIAVLRSELELEQQLIAEVPPPGYNG